MNTNTQIPMPPRRWLLRFGLPLFILGLAVALLLSTMWSSIMPARSVRVVSTLVRDVEVQIDATPSGGSATEAIVQAPGWVEADPFSIYAGALAEGVVKEIHVLEGDRVVAGQPVATLVEDDARLALQRAEAVVVHLQASVAKAEANLAQLPKRIDAAAANRNALEDEVRRKTALLESGAVAEGPVHRLTMKLEAANAGIEQLQIEEQLLKAQVMEAEAHLAEGEATRDEAALRLERMTVISPVDGIVIELLASPGSSIRFGDNEHRSHVLHLYDPEKLQVRADVPLASAAMVGVGQPARIVVDLLPDKVYEGVVTRFLHKADLQKNTVEAKVRIIDPSPLLKPDMLARVRILPAADPVTSEGMQRVPRTFVPTEAIVNGEAWILEPTDGDSGIARKRIPTIGTNEHDGWIEIIEGLNPGDRVILDADGLNDGDRVRSEGGER